MVNRLHSQATKLTLTAGENTRSVSWLSVSANTPISTGNRHGSLRMPGYKTHPKIRFLKNILPNILPVINRGY